MNLLHNCAHDITATATAERNLFDRRGEIYLRFKAGPGDTRTFAVMTPSEARALADSLRSAAAAAEAMDAELAAKQQQEQAEGMAA